MNNPSAQFWNERYSQPEYAYGEAPNGYLKQQLERLPAGAALFAAEGEGRNAVFAAKVGWQATAFDISHEGRRKALLLADKNNVAIDYHVGELEELDFEAGQFDALVLIYAHFPASIKSVYHQALDEHLRPGGTVIFEAFSKKHIDYILKNDKVGGPRDPDVLFSLEEIQTDFPNYDILELMETEVELHEGRYHNGYGSVIRFVGRKKC